MDSALWAAKTGLEAQQTRMTVTANNLANVNTTGFKRSRVAFEDLMYQTVRQTGRMLGGMLKNPRVFCSPGTDSRPLTPDA